MMSNFQEMTVVQLKEFLSAHRNDNEMFSEALGELLSRNPDRQRYPADMSTEEIGQVISEKIDQIRKK